MNQQGQTNYSSSSTGNDKPCYQQFEKSSSPQEKNDAFGKSIIVFHISNPNKQCVFQSYINDGFFQFLRANQKSKIIASQENRMLMQTVLDDWIKQSNVKQHANQLLNKILVNLVSFNSLFQQQNICHDTNMSNKNIKKLLIFGSQYLKTHKLAQKKDESNEYQRNNNKQIQDILAHMDHQYYSMRNYFNKSTPFQEKIKLIMEGSMIKRWTNHLLQVLCMSDAIKQSNQSQGKILGKNNSDNITKNKSKKQITIDISRIFLFKLLKAKLLEVFKHFNNEIYSLNNKYPNQDINQINICKLIATKSGISNFLQMQISQDQANLYEQRSSREFYKFVSIKQKWIELIKSQQKVNINNRFTFQDNLLLYQIDLLKFTQKTLLKGLKIQIKEDKLFIKNNTIQYKIDQIFTISKTKEKLKQQCPQLYHFINDNAFLSTKIYFENEILQRRKEHFVIAQKNIQFCFNENIFKKTRSYLSPSILEKINSKIPYSEQQFQDLKNIYKEIKAQLNILKNQSDKEQSKQEIFECKQDIIESILSSLIDILAFLIFKNERKLPYSQYLIFVRSLERKQSYQDQFIACLFREQSGQKKNQKILQLAKILQNINQQFNTGIIGVQSIVQDFIKVEIDLDYLNPREHIFLSQLNPETAKEYILKACLPLPHKNIQSKQGMEVFAYNHAYQVTRKFISNIEISFSNLSKKNIRSPLLLPRHFTIQNIQNEKNFPIIYPKINIISCFLDSINLNLKNLPSIITQFYINKHINALNLPIPQHNYLIFFIFIHLINRNNSQSQFLFQLNYHFDHLPESLAQLIQHKKSGQIQIVSLLKYLNQKINDQQICHPYVLSQKITTTTITTIYRQQINQRLRDLKIKRNISLQRQQLYELEQDIYTKEQLNILKKQQQRTIDKSFRSIPGEQVSGFFLFNLNNYVKYYKKHHYKYEEGKDETQNNRNRILLEINYINTKYLFNQLLNKPFQYIPPIIKFSSLHFEINNSHLQYLVIIQQQRIQNIQNKTVQLFNDHTNKFRKYVEGLNNKDKILFIKKMLQIAKQSNSLKIQLLNLDIFILQLCKNPNQKIQIAKLNDVPFCYVFAEDLQKINCRLFQQYLAFCPPRQKQTQNNFSLSSYPPFVWLFYRLQLVTSLAKTIKNSSKYDVGHLGYILCSLFYFQKDPGQSQFEQQCYFHKFYNDQTARYKLLLGLPQQEYHERINRIHRTINDDLHQTYRHRYPWFQVGNNSLQTFLMKTIHPSIENRFSVDQAIRQLDNRLDN